MSKAHWLALSITPGIGAATVRRLLHHFGNVEAIFEAPQEELRRVPRLTDEVVARLRTVSLDALEAELASFIQEGVHVLTWDDPEYPANLRQASDAPPVLFVRGQLLPADVLAVAIVGTRRPTPEALAIAETLARELAWRGLTIVSGLALGIDTAAHRGALRVAGGRTLAVFGSGLRAIHPRQNVTLAQAITRRGALLSELHPDTPVQGRNLMARDRILSGLSRAVIVVEAEEKSGSLDTAAKARRQGRLLFAVPGSPGTQALLAAGAEAVDFQTAASPGLAELLDRLCQRILTPTPSKANQQLSLWNGEREP